MSQTPAEMPGYVIDFDNFVAGELHYGVQVAAEQRFGQLDDAALEDLYWHGLQRAIALRDRLAEEAGDDPDRSGQPAYSEAFRVLIMSGAVSRAIAARDPDGVAEPRLDRLWHEAEERYGDRDLEHRGQPYVVEFDAFGRHQLSENWREASDGAAQEA
jgi:hypothetical protein